MVGKSVSLIFISCLQSSNDEGGLIFRNFCLPTINTDILVHKDEWIKATNHAKFYLIIRKLILKYDVKLKIYNETCYR